MTKRLKKSTQTLLLTRKNSENKCTAARDAAALIANSRFVAIYTNYLFNRMDLNDECEPYEFSLHTIGELHNIATP